MRLFGMLAFEAIFGVAAVELLKTAVLFGIGAWYLMPAAILPGITLALIIALMLGLGGWLSGQPVLWLSKAIGTTTVSFVERSAGEQLLTLSVIGAVVAYALAVNMAPEAALLAVAIAVSWRAIAELVAARRRRAAHTA